MSKHALDLSVAKSENLSESDRSSNVGTNDSHPAEDKSVFLTIVLPGTSSLLSSIFPINIPSLIAAFRAAPQLSTELSSLSTISTGIPPPMTTLSISLSLRPSWGSSSSGRGSCINSDDGNRGSSSGISNGSSKSGSINGSDGSDDSLLYGVAMNQRDESALHSFVVEDAKMVLQLGKADGDRDAIKSVLVDRTGERIPPLSAAENAFLALHYSRQLTGHKADGLMYGTAKNLEYCVLEMVKMDQGQFANEALNDTRKLANMMKDMGD
ncbi:MAG: hypothetical protein J3R72DRAFT_415763 [Linnemannia gamsii]|nr:MAG: hypothetical protein J3R72DRAFT_415763 [Linnemannia gamsii]